MGGEPAAGRRVEAVTAEPKKTPYTGTCGETHYLDGTNVELRFTVDRDAPLTHAAIVIRANGVFDGRTLTHTAKARYFRRRVRHIGDAEEEELRVTVAEAPGVVLEVPQSLTLAKDGSAALTAIVTRLDATLRSRSSYRSKARGKACRWRRLRFPPPQPAPTFVSAPQTRPRASSAWSDALAVWWLAAATLFR